MQIQISDCAKDYITAVVSPFRNLRSYPCIPDFTIVPSFKLRAKVRGTMATGSTTGVGWVIMNPFTMAFNDATASGTTSDYPVVSTGATFAGSSIAFAVSGGAITTTGVVGNQSDSILSAANFAGTNAQGALRLVAAGLKIQYTGAPLYMQGSVYLARTSRNQVYDTSFDTGSELARDSYTVVRPISRGTEYIFYSPQGIDVCEYRNSASYLPSGGAVVGGYSLIIFIDGGAIGNPQNCLFEAIAYFEVVGCNMPTTASHSDPVGYGAGLSSLPTTAPRDPPETIIGQVLSKTRDTIVNNMSGFIANRAIPAAVNAIGNYLMSPSPAYSQISYPTVTEL